MPSFPFAFGLGQSDMHLIALPSFRGVLHFCIAAFPQVLYGGRESVQEKFVL